MKNLGLLAIALLTATTLHAQQRALYRDPAAPIEQRVEDLLARMTQEEKIAQITAIWTQKNAVFKRDGRFDPAAATPPIPERHRPICAAQRPAGARQSLQDSVPGRAPDGRAGQRDPAFRTTARGSAFRCCFTRKACMAMQPAAPRTSRRRSHSPAAGILHCSNACSR